MWLFLAGIFSPLLICIPKASEAAHGYVTAFLTFGKMGLYGSFKICSCLLKVYFKSETWCFITHTYIILRMCNAGRVQYSTEFVIWIKYSVLYFQLTQTTWLALQRSFPELFAASWVGGQGGAESLHAVSLAWCPSRAPKPPLGTGHFKASSWRIQFLWNKNSWNRF